METTFRRIGRNSAIRWYFTILLVFCASLVATVSLAEKRRSSERKPASSGGRQVFASSCAGCHGLDGRGGERAPNIAGNPKVQKLSDAQIFQIVTDGVPGTGMPAFHSLTEPERRAVVTYLRTLQGRDRTSALPGSPVRGKEIFFGKGECSRCHMVLGQGGYLGSDLSTYAQSKSAEQVRNTILNPSADPDPHRRVALAVTRDGARITGLVRNEDNFSVQLQTSDGAFHFLNKSDLDKLEFGPQTIMPSDYGEKLSAPELDDIVSYLINSARMEKSVRGIPEEE